MCNCKETQEKKKETHQELRNEQQRAKCSNCKVISEICQEQEEEENRERTTTLSRNADFRR